MMKILILVVAASLVPSARSFSAETARAADLPTLEEFHQSLSAMPVPESPASAPPAAVADAAGTAPCAVPALSGARIRAKAFSLGWGLNDDVKSGGKAIGRIEGNLTGTSIVYRDSSGAVVAQALRTSENDQKTRVLDCGGRELGEILAIPAPHDNVSFQVRGADGVLVGDSGNITDRTEDLQLTGSGGVVVRAQGGNGYALTIAPSFDPRLAAMFVAVKTARDMRISTRRRRHPVGGR